MAKWGRRYQSARTVGPARNLFLVLPPYFGYIKTVEAEMSPYLIPQKEIADVPPIIDSPYF